jgi:hypothetical protein
MAQIDIKLLCTQGKIAIQFNTGEASSNIFKMSTLNLFDARSLRLEQFLLTAKISMTFLILQDFSGGYNGSTSSGFGSNRRW